MRKPQRTETDRERARVPFLKTARERVRVPRRFGIKVAGSRCIPPEDRSKKGENRWWRQSQSPAGEVAC